MRVLSDVPLSRNWYKTMSKLYENLFIHKILYKKTVGSNRSYSETLVWFYYYLNLIIYHLEKI